MFGARAVAKEAQAGRLSLLPTQKGLTTHRRKSLRCKQCGKQDLNLHPLAGTRPSAQFNTRAKQLRVRPSHCRQVISCHETATRSEPPWNRRQQRPAGCKAKPAAWPPRRSPRRRREPMRRRLQSMTLTAWSRIWTGPYRKNVSRSDRFVVCGEFAGYCRLLQTMTKFNDLRGNGRGFVVFRGRLRDLLAARKALAPIPDTGSVSRRHTLHL